MHRIKFTIFSREIDTQFSTDEAIFAVGAVVFSIATGVMYLWPFFR